MGEGGRPTSSAHTTDGPVLEPWPENAHLLVTGGAGFIGSNFTRLVLERHPEVRVTVLDKLTYAGHPSTFRYQGIADHPRFRFVQGDIAEPRDVAAVLPGCTHVVNFAAETHVDRSIGEPAGFIRTDVYGVYVLLEQARKSGVRRFLHISTDEVYGEVMHGAATEDAPLVPRNPYAASKAGGERLAYSYYATYGVPVVITRCSNNYGPFQYPEKMIPLFITNALEDRSLPVYGSGHNVRDWIHVEDHCVALLSVLRLRDADGEVFNVAGRTERSILDIAAFLLDELGKPRSLIEHVKDRLGHDRRYAIDDTKLRARTGWAPAVDFDAGLRATIRWYVETRGWWEEIRSGAFREYYEKMYGVRG
jgi:dTDP-glucose 4,6-dehydratase